MSFKNKILLALVVLPVVAADIPSPKEVTVSFDDVKEMSVDLDILTQSSAVMRNMIEDLGDTGEPIPIPNVSSGTFATLYGLMEKIYNKPDSELPRIINPEMRGYSFDKLMDLIIAANFLYANKLLDPLIIAFSHELLKPENLAKYGPKFDFLNGLPDDIKKLIAKNIQNKVFFAIFPEGITNNPVKIVQDVSNVAYSPDGKYLAGLTTKENENISKVFYRLLKILNTETWNTTEMVFEKIRTSRDQPVRATFSPDGKYLAIGFNDPKLTILDFETKNRVKTFMNTSSVDSASFSPNGKYLVTVNMNPSYVTIWDIATGDRFRTFPGYNYERKSVAFSPNGKHIAIGDMHNRILILDIETGDLVRELVGHADWVSSVAYSPDGKYLVSVSPDRTIRIWDTESGNTIITIADEQFPHLAYSPDGKYLAVASGKKIQILDSKTRDLVRMLGYKGLGDFSSITYSPDGKYLASVHNGNLIIWDMRDMYTEPLPLKLLLLLFSIHHHKGQHGDQIEKIREEAESLLPSIQDETLKTKLQEYINKRP